MLGSASASRRSRGTDDPLFFRCSHKENGAKPLQPALTGWFSSHLIWPGLLNEPPVRANKVASRYLFEVAANPPFQVGEFRRGRAVPAVLENSGLWRRSCDRRYSRHCRHCADASLTRCRRRANVLLRPMRVDAGSGVTVSNVNVVSPTSATATFGLSAVALVGSNSATVTTPGTSNARSAWNRRYRDLWQ
jgi:hypothetical protein